MDLIKEFGILKESIKNTNKNAIIEMKDGEQIATILKDIKQIKDAERITIFVEGNEIEFSRCS